jgi:hypothetical protein
MPTALGVGMGGGMSTAFLERNEVLYPKFVGSTAEGGRTSYAVIVAGRAVFEMHWKGLRAEQCKAEGQAGRTARWPLKVDLRSFHGDVFCTSC